MMMRLPLGTIRLLLAAVLSVSVSGAVLSGRTLAGFTAETINPGNVFQTGTLELKSYFGASNSSAGGYGLFMVRADALPPPESTATSTVATSTIATDTVSGPSSGLAPGLVLANSIRLHNTGKDGKLPLPADRLKFYLTAARVANQPSKACNPSNLLAGSAGSSVQDTCGTERLANAIELMMLYPVLEDTTNTQFVCVYPTPQSESKRVVTVADMTDLGDPSKGCGFGPLASGAPALASSAPDDTAPIDMSQYIMTALKYSPSANPPAFGLDVPGYNRAKADGVQNAPDCLAGAVTPEPCVRKLWKGEEFHTLVIAVRIRPDAGNEYLGASASFDFEWRAESGPGQ